MMRMQGECVCKDSNLPPLGFPSESNRISICWNQTVQGSRQIHHTLMPMLRISRDTGISPPAYAWLRLRFGCEELL